MIPLIWKLRPSPCHFVLLMPLNQKAKKALTVLTEVTDPDNQRETGLLLHNGGKKEYVWNISVPLGYFFVLPFPVIKVSRKLKQPNLSRITNGPYPAGMKV